MADIVLAGLSTTSDGKLLETGGMLYVSATSEGRKLQVAEGERVLYTFPNVNNKTDMQLFNGNMDENEFVNWTPEEPPLLFTYLVTSPIGGFIETEIYKVRRPTTYDTVYTQEDKNCNDSATLYFLNN